MRTLLSRAIQVDPTFHIGLSLIVILAMVEIFAATSYYVGRTRAARVSAPSVAVAPHKDVGGNRDGSVMGISEVKTTETPDPDAEKNLTLEIGIKKQSGATIDHMKVKILVEFYDTVGDKDIKLTNADVNYEWLTPKHDWSETNPEVLSVRY